MCQWKTANTPVSEFLLVKNIGSSSFIVDFFIYLTWNDVVLTGQPSLVWKLELCFVVVYLFQRSNFLRSPVTCTNGERPLCFCWVDWGVVGRWSIEYTRVNECHVKKGPKLSATCIGFSFHVQSCLLPHDFSILSQDAESVSLSDRLLKYCYVYHL